MNLWFFFLFQSGNWDMNLFCSLYPDTCWFCKIRDDMAVISIHGTYCTQLHFSIREGSHKSFIWFSSLCRGWVHESKLKDLFCNLASYGRKHTCPFRVRLSSRYRIQFCSKTCKSLHLQCNYGSVWLEFPPHNEHMRRTTCKDIMK